jgi:hypothetical protein
MFILSGSNRFCLQLSTLKNKLACKLRGPQSKVLLAVETFTHKIMFNVCDWNNN